jgi:hypothetical protein
MKQIYGYVLVKQTNYGVPNLVVTAYDSEKSLEELRANKSEEGSFSLENLGKRLGSILTGKDGKFVLQSEELEFQGNESRPDLLIVIFAPEDIQTVDNPFPLPPEKRVLYVSTVSRTDAGAEEAFVIRLLQEQLDHFNISVPSSTGTSNADSDRFAQAVESTWDFRDNVRKRFKERLQEEHNKSQEIKQKVQDKLKDFSAIPLHLRNNSLRNNRLLITGKKNLAVNLVEKQHDSIKEGLVRFRSRKPAMRLTLTKDDLKELGLKEEKNGKITGTVPAKKLAAKVRSLINGVDLVRVRGLNNPSPDALEQKYLIENSPPKVDEPDD